MFDTSCGPICPLVQSVHRLAYKPDAKIDWAWRGEAMAGRRSPTPDFMVACRLMMVAVAVTVLDRIATLCQGCLHLMPRENPL